MRCPFCGHEDTQVKDSRPTDDNSAIRRRRYCPSCGSRFTTFERVQLRELTVVKKNGQRVQFAFFWKLDGDAGCDPADNANGHSQGLSAIANVSGHELAEAAVDVARPPPSMSRFCCA